MGKNEDFILDTEDINSSHKRLLDRYKALENLIDNFPSNSGLENIEKENLVVTDLFVEKDILMLEQRADKLQNQANTLFKLVISIFSITAMLAIYQMLSYKPKLLEWEIMVVIFIKSFTAYGLLILVGATSWKHSKAKHDQAERLYAKRRHNRQLRIFLHLNKGTISQKDMLSFIKQGKDENNAFENIPAEAKAPWGNVISDLLKTQASIIKSLSSRSSHNSNSNN